MTARAAAAPRSGWSGTIVWDYISQHHEVRDAETADITWHRRLQITVENGVATASGTYLLSLDDTVGLQDRANRVRLHRRRVRLVHVLR